MNDGAAVAYGEPIREASFMQENEWPRAHPPHPSLVLHYLQAGAFGGSGGMFMSGVHDHRRDKAGKNRQNKYNQPHLEASPVAEHPVQVEPQNHRPEMEQSC
jgi:hypothetical protein